MSLLRDKNRETLDKYLMGNAKWRELTEHFGTRLVLIQTANGPTALHFGVMHFAVKAGNFTTEFKPTVDEAIDAAYESMPSSPEPPAESSAALKLSESIADTVSFATTVVGQLKTALLENVELRQSLAEKDVEIERLKADFYGLAILKHQG